MGTRTPTLRPGYPDGKKEAKRTLGNNNPTHFLSFLAVNCSWLDCMHVHVQVLKSLLCLRECSLVVLEAFNIDNI